MGGGESVGHRGVEKHNAPAPFSRPVDGDSVENLIQKEYSDVSVN